MNPAGWCAQRWRSLDCAAAGLRVLLRTQVHARLHLLATVVVLGAAAATGLGRADWLALIIAITAVWVAEAMNTALEFLADATHPQPHPLIGQAKDAAAAAVLLAAIGAVAIAALVFLPHWF